MSDNPEYIDIYDPTDGYIPPEACPIPTNGADGVGISTIQQVGSTNVLVITLTNNAQYSFTIPTISGSTGAKGDKGDKGDTGNTGATGAAGTNGNNGTNGTNGINGTNGTNGLNGINIRSGSGVPSNGLGSNGDGYLDYTTGNFYTKSGGVYTLQSSLKGDDGVDGTNGTTTTIDDFGGSVPTITGLDGDLAIDDSTLKYYYLSSGTWNLSGTIGAITSIGNQTTLSGNKKTSGLWEFDNAVVGRKNLVSFDYSPYTGDNLGGWIIGTNASGALGEVDLMSVKSNIVGTEGGFRLYNVESDNSLTLLLNLHGGTKSLETYGTIKPGVVSSSGSVSNKYLTLDAVNGFIISRTIKQLVNDLVNSSTTGSATLGLAAGTGASVTIYGNNQDGIISLTTGSSPATSDNILTFTMSGSFAYPNQCTPILMPSSTTAILVTNRIFVTNLVATGFELWVDSSALNASTTYVWTFHNGGF